MTETEWAIRNLELAGHLSKEGDFDGMIGEAVKNLLYCHQSERHSGGSHFQTIDLFCKVAKGEPLTMAYWREKYEAYNKLSMAHGFNTLSEDQFEELIMPKPRSPAP